MVNIWSFVQGTNSKCWPECTLIVWFSGSQAKSEVLTDSDVTLWERAVYIFFRTKKRQKSDFFTVGMICKESISVSGLGGSWRDLENTLWATCEHAEWISEFCSFVVFNGLICLSLFLVWFDFIVVVVCFYFGGFFCVFFFSLFLGFFSYIAEVSTSNLRYLRYFSNVLQTTKPWPLYGIHKMPRLLDEMRLFYKELFQDFLLKYFRCYKFSYLISWDV